MRCATHSSALACTIAGSGSFVDFWEALMRSRIFAVLGLVGALFCGCGDTDPGPALSISPSGLSGTVEVTSPTVFTARLVNSTADVTWTATGGTLSGTSGLHVVYLPPLGTASGTLTATAAGMTATVQVSSMPATLTGKNIPGLTVPVTVQYDAQDIPHIKCAAMIDCLAVQGYVEARDRLFPMDFFRHVARSKLAELIGLDGLSQDVQLRTLFITRAGHRLEDDLAANMDPAISPLAAAFAGGINAYLAELRATPAARLPAEYAQLPFPLTPADIADWTVQDTMALARLQQFQLSENLTGESAFGQFAAVYGPGAPLQDLGKLNAWIRAAAPPTEQAHTLEPTPFHPPSPLTSGRLPGVELATWKDVLSATAAHADSFRAFLLPADAAVGSNNWVVSEAKSATHVAMVANDPHLLLQYPPLFHLSVMTSTNLSDNLDLAGGAFPGIPGVLVGRGAHVGWGVTVVGYDVTDLYLEQFLPQNNCPTTAPCVLFKGAPTSTLAVPQTFLVRTAAGLVDAQTLSLPSPPPPVVLVVPHHGPIIQAPDAAGKAVSARWTGHEGNTQDLKAILGLNTAVDVDAAMIALKDFSTGAQNFALADDKGHIAYDAHALVPVRKFTEGASPIPPWFPLPGDGSAEWGDGTSNCAAAGATSVPGTCWIADGLLPQGKDPAKGYFFTANADPTSPSTTDDNNPLAHLPYLSFAWGDSTGFRATRIEQMLEAAIAADGSVSLDDMEAMQADQVSRPGMVFTAFIAQLPTSASSPPELAVAKGVLNQWAANGWHCPSGLLGTDPKTSPVDTTPTVVQNSSGCFLFHAFLRVLFTNVFADDLKVAGQDVNDGAATKAMIFMLGLDPATPQGAAGSTFCNDVDATAQLVTAHTCAAQVVTALVQAVNTLTAQVGPQPSDWVWGRVHTIKPVSQLALVTTDFALGPYARPGGFATIDVGSPALSGGGLDFAYNAGANVRHISLMDPMQPVVKMQLPGPERDGPAVFIGPDLIGQWVKNTYFDFAFGAQIDGVAVSTQTFKAP
jgi:penicillin amidase